MVQITIEKKFNFFGLAGSENQFSCPFSFITASCVFLFRASNGVTLEELLQIVDQQRGRSTTSVVAHA